MRILISMLVLLFSSIIGSARGEDLAQIDSMKFGQLSGAAVKLAIGLDYINRRCNGETALIHVNQLNYILKQIGGRSTGYVLENSAKVMGTTPKKLWMAPTQEVEDMLSQYGGCASNAFRSTRRQLQAQFADYQRQLTEIAELIKQNPGQDLFR